MASPWMENGSLPNYLDIEWKRASAVEFGHEVNRLVSLESLGSPF